MHEKEPKPNEMFDQTAIYFLLSDIAMLTAGMYNAVDFANNLRLHDTQGMTQSGLYLLMQVAFYALRTELREYTK